MAKKNLSNPVPSSQEIHSVALYARVSTLNGQNPDMQLAELREYAQRRGWTISGEFVDLGVSGSRESRPEFNRLMADAHRRTFDAIACWKLDRMGRSLKHLVVTLEDLQAYGVAFVSLRDDMDLSTPSGRLQFHIIAAMAEFERALIRERVSAGIHAARNRGVRIGRPRVYVSADKVRTMRETGTSWRAISRKLGIGVGTAVRALEKSSAVCSQACRADFTAGCGRWLLLVVLLRRGRRAERTRLNGC